MKITEIPLTRWPIVLGLFGTDTFMFFEHTTNCRAYGDFAGVVGKGRIFKRGMVITSVNKSLPQGY